MTKQQLQTAKPIIFDTESVRGILDGRKTVVRQVIKNASPKWTFDCLSDNASITVIDRNGNEKPKEVDGLWATFNAPDEYIEFPMIKAKYHAGDILYVRETCGCYYYDYEESNNTDTLFKADYPDGAKGYWYEQEHINWCDFPRWRSPAIMPKEAARIFLEVTGVRVERLRDICKNYSNFDKEGIIEEHGFRSEMHQDFIKLWNSKIPKKDLDKYDWDANPFVWVYEFERVEVEL